MRALARHFLASDLKFFVTALFVSSIAIVIVELLLILDEILRDHADVSAVASYLFRRLPSYSFRDLIPVDSIATAFLSFGPAARAREFTAAKAGGIPPQRMVVSILGAAMLLSVGTLLFDETVGLAATRESTRPEQRSGEAADRPRPI